MAFDHFLLGLIFLVKVPYAECQAHLEKPCPERRHNDYLPIESQWDSGAFGLIWQAPCPNWKGHSNMRSHGWAVEAMSSLAADKICAKLVPNPSVDRVCDGPLS